jgi:ribosomal subunit interface protein
MDARIEIVVTGRNVEVSEYHRSYVTAKLVSLEHFNRHVIRYEVELDHEQNPRQAKSSQRATITGYGKGRTVRAEAREADFHTALDAAVGKLEGQLRRGHDRHQVHHYRHEQMTTEPGGH